jgi:hypothetical protein
MRTWSSLLVVTLAVANALSFAPPAGGQQLTPIKQAVTEIVGACAIGPTSSIKDAVSATLEEFLRESIETQSANYNKLMDMLGRLPTNTEEAIMQLKNERARQTFFSAYFNCLRHQASLKLKSFGLASQ